MLIHDRALRSRILGIIALALPAGCSDPDGGAGGAGGSLPAGCYEDEVGVCCVDPEPDCYTQQEIVDLTANVGGGASGGSTAAFECPALDRHTISDCEWLTGSPAFENGTCCYTHEGGNCCGRPFIVGGAQLVASTEARDDWSGAPPQPAWLDDATRQQLAREWRDDALLEHASIAAFSRFTLQLMQLGAPRELIAASQRASLDELAHAEACFAQAARFGGAPIGPGPLDVAGALGSASLPEIAALAVIEGCIGETVAASLASSALAVAVDTDAASALRRIAADEADHAALAWRFVAWALAQGDTEVHVAVRRAFSGALAAVASEDVTAPGISVAALHCHGRLTASEKHAAQARALETVVRPCAQALLASVPSPRSFPRVSAIGA